MSTAEVSVSLAQALAWRLERHLLDPVGTESTADVVRRLGGVLSMSESLAELAVRVRQQDSQPGDLARAHAAGEVVEAYSFHGSAHFMAPEDAGLWLALRCAGRQWERRSWVEHYRLTAEAWIDLRASVRDALAAGPLTPPELADALAVDRRWAHLHGVFAEGGGHLVKPLMWQGDVGYAPRRDGRRTLQRLDASPRWAGVPDLEDAGPRAVLAHAATYGPVTPEQLHHWLGTCLSVGAKRLDGWVAGLGDRLVPVDVDGEAAYVVREHAAGLAAATPSVAVRLLPGHDQWVMGVGTKDESVTPPALRQAMTRKANPVVVGGVVRGTWARRDDELTVTWADGPAPRAALGREVERLAVILDRDLRLVLA